MNVTCILRARFIVQVCCTPLTAPSLLAQADQELEAAWCRVSSILTPCLVSISRRSVCLLYKRTYAIVISMRWVAVTVLYIYNHQLCWYPGCIIRTVELYPQWTAIIMAQQLTLYTAKVR